MLSQYDGYLRLDNLSFSSAHSLTYQFNPLLSLLSLVWRSELMRNIKVAATRSHNHNGMLVVVVVEGTLAIYYTSACKNGLHKQEILHSLPSTPYHSLTQSFMIPSSDLYLSYSILSSSPPSQSQLQVLYITLVSAILGRITSRIREVSGHYRVSHPKLCRDLNFSDLTCNTYLHTVSSVWEMHGDNSRTALRRTYQMPSVYKHWVRDTKR